MVEVTLDTLKSQIAFRFMLNVMSEEPKDPQALRDNIVKFLLLEDVSVEDKKQLHDYIQERGQAIFRNHEQRGGGELSETKLRDVALLSEMDQLITETLIMDQKIPLEVINQLHKQYYGDQSLINSMSKLDWSNYALSTGMCRNVTSRLFAQMQRMPPDQRQVDDEISIPENQGQQQSESHHNRAIMQTDDKQIIAEIMFRQLSWLGANMPRYFSRVTDYIDSHQDDPDASKQLIETIAEQYIEYYLESLALFNALNDAPPRIADERVNLISGVESLDITDMLKWISQRKRQFDPNNVAALIRKVQDGNVSMGRKEVLLSEFDEYLVFLNQEDRDKLSATFVSQALEKNALYGLLLSGNISKLGPGFINGIFAKKSVSLTPQCAEKMLSLQKISKRSQAQLRLQRPTWRTLEVSNIMEYAKSEFCQREDSRLDFLKEALGRRISEALYENNDLSDSGRVKHIASLFPMLTEDECLEMILQPTTIDEHDEDIEEEDGYALIGSLYLCGLAGWSPKIDGRDADYARMSSDTVDETNQTGSEINSQESNLIANKSERKGFLSWMRKKSVKEIAKSIAENQQNARLITGNVMHYPKSLNGVSTSKTPRVTSGADMGHNITSFLTADDLENLRRLQDSVQVRQESIKKKKPGDTPRDEDSGLKKIRG